MILDIALKHVPASLFFAQALTVGGILLGNFFSFGFCFLILLSSDPSPSVHALRSSTPQLLCRSSNSSVFRGGFAPPVLSLLILAGIIVLMVTMLRSARSPVHGRKTSWPAGTLLDPCHFFSSFLSSFFSTFFSSFFSPLPNGSALIKLEKMFYNGNIIHKSIIIEITSVKLLRKVKLMNRDYLEVNITSLEDITLRWDPIIYFVHLFLLKKNWAYLVQPFRLREKAYSQRDRQTDRQTDR